VCGAGLRCSSRTRQAGACANEAAAAIPDLIVVLEVFRHGTLPFSGQKKNSGSMKPATRSALCQFGLAG